jgi:hypothetical protein
MKPASPMLKNSLISLLCVVYASLALFGIILAFFWRRHLAAGLMDMLIKPFYVSGAPDAESARLLGFVFGVMGAMMLSWASLMAMLAIGPLRRGEGWAFWALLAGAVLWFAIDESFSVYFRVWANAIGNVIILAWMLFPLIVLKLRGEFGRR